MQGLYKRMHIKHPEKADTMKGAVITPLRGRGSRILSGQISTPHWALHRFSLIIRTSVYRGETCVPPRVRNVPKVSPCCSCYLREDVNLGPALPPAAAHVDPLGAFVRPAAGDMRVLGTPERTS